MSKSMMPPPFRSKTGSAFSVLFFLLAASSLLPAQSNNNQDGGKGDAQAMHLMQLGAGAMQQGNTAEAERYFTKATAAAPQMADAFLDLGLVQLREGRPDVAEKALAKAIALNPKLPGAHMFLGIAKYQMHEVDSASADLREELRLQPQDVEALTWLGIVELGAGNADKATEPLDRAAALSPNDPNILYLRGRAHSLIAEESYQALYRLDPDSWRVHKALGESYSASGQPEKAVAEFLKAVGKEPTNSDLYESLGDEYQKLSRFDDAMKAYEQEVKLDPNNGIALYNLGKIDVERGDPQAGISLLQQAISVHSSPAPSDFYLGLGLSKVGKNEEAAEWLEKSLQSDPSEFIKQSTYYELVRVYQKLGRRQDSQRALDELKKLKSASTVTNQP
ncbi:tetratricopeptide repeat protein [Edaphobacter paludis]|uniref:Tetratricopeptide repeat protein n=1 Tax=Edaphobacter paludis TaxID=3035702 RepID=A0AAU7CVM6_9BACT